MNLQEHWESIFVGTDKHLHEFERICDIYLLRDAAYHNLDHILVVLDQVLGAEQKIAAFYHDLFPDELDSAEDLWMRFPENSYGGGWRVAGAVQCVIASIPGRKASTISQGEFQDADLSVLCGTPKEYQEYVDKVREEYSWASDTEWKEGRIQVLTSLLKKERIFNYRPVNDELQARANLNNELGKLGVYAY